MRERQRAIRSHECDSGDECGGERGELTGRKASDESQMFLLSRETSGEHIS